MSKAEWAIKYAKLGWSVIPQHAVIKGRCTCGNQNCKHPGKHPIIKNPIRETTPEEVQQWWEKWPWANIGLCLAYSNIAVLDLDSPDAKKNALKLLETENLYLHTLPLVAKSGGAHQGWHIFFQNQGLTKPYNGLFELKAGKCHITLPPSTGIKGEYMWLTFQPEKIIIIPEKILQAVKPQTKKAPSQKPQPIPTSSPTLKGKVGPGNRNNHLARLSLFLASSGMLSWQAICAAVKAENQAVCCPPLSDDEIEKTVLKSAAEKYKKTDETLLFAPMTDAGNAAFLAGAIGHNWRYSAALGWLYWDGKKWAEDKSGRLYSDAVLAFRRRKEALRNYEDTGKLIEFCTKCENKARLTSAETLLRHHCEFKGKFNDNPLLIAFQNGTYDLETETFREHRRSDYNTMLAGTEFDESCPTPKWNQFLQSIWEDNEMIEYIQRVLGYASTGLTSEKTLWFLWGTTGWNGKSALIHIISQVLGDYAATAQLSVFSEQNRSSIPNDLARLADKRFVSVSEAQSRVYLDEKIIKQITGSTDKIVARFLHREFFEFQPVAKVFIATNQLPLVKEGDKPFWERVKVIPFSKSFYREARQKAWRKEGFRTFEEQFVPEYPGIAAWLVEGALKYIKYGLDTPAEVQSAVEEYKSNANPLEAFIQDCCIVQDNLVQPLKEFYNVYQAYCKENGYSPLGKIKLSKQLESMGFQKTKSKEWIITGLQVTHSAKQELIL